MLHPGKPGRLRIDSDQQIGVLQLSHHGGDEGGLIGIDAGRCDRLDPEIALAVETRGQREAAGLDFGNENRRIPGRAFTQLVCHHLRLGIGQPPKLQPVS